MKTCIQGQVNSFCNRLIEKKITTFYKQYITASKHLEINKIVTVRNALILQLHKFTFTNK